MTSTCAPLPFERRHSGDRAILSPDGRFLAVPGANHTVLVLDAMTNEPWVTYYGHQAGVYRRVSGTIKALAWLADGSSVASGSTDGSIHLWHGRRQPCAVAMHALDRVDIQPGQSVALYGVGGIGGFLLAALVAETQGDLSLIVVEVDERKRYFIERLGAPASTFIITDELTETAIWDLTAGRGVDLAIEASGSPTAVQQALAVIRKGGTLFQVGIPAGRVSLPLGQLVPREVNIVTTNGMICDVDLPKALVLLSQTDLATRITDRIISLERLVSDGLEPLALYEVLGKVLVQIQEAPYAVTNQ